MPVGFVGTIGFVGLVGPHIARMILGEDQRFFLPGSVLSGALLLSLTSVVSKSIIPGVDLPDRHHHRAGRRALLLLADPLEQEPLMVALQLDESSAPITARKLFARRRDDAGDDRRARSSR